MPSKVRLKGGLTVQGVTFIYLKTGKKSTKLAAGDPASTVKVPARSAMERKFKIQFGPEIRGNDQPKRTNKSSTERMSYP